MPAAKNILHFLTQLKENNNREWFTQNKEWYNAVRAEFEQVVSDLIAEISKFDEDIKHVTPKECLYRIYRDIRFSNDKTPYKIYFGAYMAAAGGRKSERSGYYLHLQPEGSFLSTGVWCPQPNILKALRQSVYDNIDELDEIRTNPEFARYYTNLYEEGKLKNVPWGFPKDFPDAELLKLKHYLVDYPIDNALIESEDFAARAAKIFEAGYPFNRFLNYTIDEIIGYNHNG